MLSASEKIENAKFMSRVERLKLAKGWTWQETAEKLQLSRNMLHLLKREVNRVSKKNWFRLEHVEREMGIAPQNVKKVTDALLAHVEEARVEVSPADYDRGFVEVPVEYVRRVPPPGHPEKIRLKRPDVKRSATLLANLLAEEDFEPVLLACIYPPDYANRDFLNLLTPFSYQALADAAVSIAFGSRWRVRLKQQQ